MILRPYQQQALDATDAAFTRVRSVLNVLATGLGKTVIFSHVAKDYMTRGRVLILAHREELLQQAGQKIHAIAGVRPDLEMGDSRASGLFRSPVVLTSVQTQTAGVNGHRRMHRFDPNEFSLLVVDECHHAVSPSNRAVIDYYRQNPNLCVFGCTATPDRHDEEALGKVFEEVAFNYGIREGIDDGWLCDIRQQFVEVTGLDFSACRTTAGDLNQKDLAAVMEAEKQLHGVVSATLDLCRGRRTLVFAASVSHGERMTEIFNRHEPGSTRFVCGATESVERRQTINKFRLGEFPCLVNVGIATEGFDVPEISAVVLARPTKSRSLYSQMVGRGTRPDAACIQHLFTPEDRRCAISNSAKAELLVVDFVGNAGRHKLVHTADILGEGYSDEVVELAERLAKSRGTSRIREVLAEAEKLERMRHRIQEAAQRSVVRGKAEYRTSNVDPFNVFELPARRERGWEVGKKATPNEVRYLAQLGDNAKAMSLAQASQIIDEVVERSRLNLCTYKQARLLRQHGYATDVSKSEASKIIDGIAANGWRRVGT